MNWDLIRTIGEFAQMSLTFAIGVYLYLEKKNDNTNIRIGNLEATTNTRIQRTEDDVAGKHSDHERRIAMIEGAIQHLPKHDDMTKVREELAHLSAETEGQTALLQQLTGQVNRINDWLIQRAK